MNVYGKLQQVTVDLQNTSLKKSGKNAFAGFKYFELGDFLPTVNNLFIKYGLNGIVSYDNDLAYLIITNTDEPSEQVVIKSPMVQITMKGANEIQALGAVETYQRRYLYMAALGITENDVVDAQEQVTHEAKATKKQKEIILNGDPDRVMKALEYYKVKAVEDLTVTQASKIIEQFSK